MIVRWRRGVLAAALASSTAHGSEGWSVGMTAARTMEASLAGDVDGTALSVDCTDGTVTLRLVAPPDPPVLRIVFGDRWADAEVALTPGPEGTYEAADSAIAEMLAVYEPTVSVGSGDARTEFSAEDTQAALEACGLDMSHWPSSNPRMPSRMRPRMRVEPDYPRAGVSALCRATALVDPFGFPVRAQIVGDRTQCPYDFAAAVVEAMLRAKWRPAEVDGEPVWTKVVLRYRFQP